MLDVIELSRLQFALTALYHFIFVPLTLGLSFLLVVMETLYVTTGKEVYKDMTKFWGKLFGINFALGVTTGITMEFQFGTNWSYYSHYVGDIFGAPLAIEGLMAFFLESTFVGLFFFGWERLSKGRHLITTYCVAFGSNLSALWILVANGWMQNPTGSTFNFETMRMEMSSFTELLLNPVAQTKFLHTVSAGYVCGSIFVLGVSSYYLIKKQDLSFAKRSFSVGASFGLVAIFSVLFMGDESGYEIGKAQPVKLAAMEGEWETQEAPASWHAIAIADSKSGKNTFEISIPYMAGIIVTRSLDTKFPGLNELRAINEQRVRNGITAYGLLQKLRSGNYTEEDKALFRDKYVKDLGFGLLLGQYVGINDMTKSSEELVMAMNNATEEQIKMAADATIPNSGPNFWAFRLMMGTGFLMMLIIGFAFWQNIKGRVGTRPLFNKVMLFSIPLPWIAIESGWFVAEYGRQPWAVFEVLPTGVANSSLTTVDLWISIGLLCGLYSIFLVAEMYLMFKYGRLGPSALKTGRYHFEQESK